MVWARQKFTKYPKSNKKTYSPYKNKFEQDIAKSMPKADYEDKTRVVPYTVKHKYNVDFTFKSIPWLLIEGKGRFHDGSREARKYIWIKKCNPQMEILFIFSNLNNQAYSGVKRRKDGSYLTMGEWAAKNNFLAVSYKHIPPWVIDGSITKKKYRDQLNKQRESYGLKQLSPYIWGD